jgi:SWI/SNF-related matrix-associated actin-dependent regulator of chromatin subfamily A-like protein 1
MHDFKIEKYRDDMIRIMVDNQMEVVNAIKSLPNKKFSPISRDWIIPRRDASKLLKLIPYDEDDSFRTSIEKLTRMPLKHQEEARDFLIDRKKAILADEMGGGKTFSSILAGNEVEGKKLVVCPSGLKINWQKEISFTTDINIDIIDDGHTWISPVDNGWTIISYDLLKEHIDIIIAEGYNVAIFDEAHYCRAVNRKGQPKSVRAKMLLELSKNVEYLFLLTGTPVVNSNKDLYILLKSIGHSLSYSWFDYSSRYCGMKAVGKRLTYDGNSHEEELYALLKFKMLRRLKDEFIDLPQKHREFIPVNIDLKEYNSKVTEYMDKKPYTRETGRHLVFLNAMRSIIAKEKAEATIRLSDKLLSEGESIVIFSNFDSVIKKVLAHYGEDAVRVTGKDSAKKRQEAVNLFQSGNKKVIVCNLIAGGVGITLTRGSHLIMNDFSWLPAEHLQAEDRIHRIGKEEECYIHYMYTSDTIDEKMAKTLEKRLNSISRTLNGVRESFVGDVVKMFS